MIIYILILMAFLLKNIRIYGKEQFADDFLERTYTERLKGICAILIVLHHISQKGHYQLPFSLFNRIGCLIVAIFFFLSGYGMSKSYNKDRKAFSSNFVFRIWHLSIPYLVVLAFTIIELRWNGNQVQIGLVIKGLRHGAVIGNWFFYSIIYLYCVFEIIFCRLPIKAKHKALVVAICIAGYFMWRANWNGWWYNSFLAFAIGSIFAFHENEITTWARKNGNYWVTVGILLLSYIGLRFLNVSLSIDTWGGLLSEALAPTVFSFAVIIINMKIRILNPIWNYIGNISYEIFLIHALLIGLYRGKNIYINNNVLFTFLVIGCSVILGALFKKCNDWIMNRTRHWFVKGEERFNE